jgi:hypothetical protein
MDSSQHWNGTWKELARRYGDEINDRNKFFYGVLGAIKIRASRPGQKPHRKTE